MKTISHILIFSYFLFSGCTAEKQKSDIVATIYPFKAIIQEIVGDRIDVKSILPAGADPHTYEMLTSDFKTIQNCTAFFYGSEALDGWAARIDVDNKIEMLKLIPDDFLIEIKVHNHFDNHNHSHNHNHNHNLDEESLGIDPHFWVDPLTVRAMLPALLNKLIKIDPENEEYFRNNEKLFSVRLLEMDSLLRLETTDIQFRNVFTAHPFYSYFFERYNFFVAGSIEIAPGYHSTPKDIKQLMDLVKRQNVKAIFTHKQHSDKPAKVLAELTGINEFELDPIGGVPGRMTYEEIIFYNLDIIKKALQ
ncbi:MAG: zinc ABC transporter substrate-binding protein [Ignavibacterium sp.]|nr:zinc ABC transporter substrate-binding protein [Ignavibacterium sp.]